MKKGYSGMGNGEEHGRRLQGVVLVVIVFFIIGGIVAAVKLAQPKVEIAQGIKKLKELEKADVAGTDAKIQELEGTEQPAGGERLRRSLNKAFAGSFLVGDSITEAAHEYGVLDSSLILARRGADVVRLEESGAIKDVEKAIKAKPKNLFLAYGENGVEASNGDVEYFVEKYRNLLAMLQEEVPDTTLYVNAVLPVQQAVIDSDERFENLPEFNSRLQELCEEVGVLFIDGTQIMKEEYFDEDGIHMVKEFYPVWLNHMAEAAGLL